MQRFFFNKNSAFALARILRLLVPRAITPTISNSFGKFLFDLVRHHCYIKVSKLLLFILTSDSRFA
jgi:hypothetical protein